MSTVKNVEKAGRQVWLAGLGACLFGKEYAVNKLDEMFEGTNSLANQVITKGQEIEADLKSKVSAGFPVSRNFLQDEKIAQLREKLGLSQDSKQDKISRLVVKVDALTEIVATISVREKEEKVAAKKSTTTPTANATPKKSTATRKPRATTSKTAPASKAASTSQSVASDMAAKKPTATRSRIRKTATAKTTAAKTTTAKATVAKTTTAETNAPKAAESAKSKTDKG